MPYKIKTGCLYLAPDLHPPATMPNPTKAQAAKTVLAYLRSPEGQRQLENVQNIPSARGGPGALIALAINTSGNEEVIVAWGIADQKQVFAELVKS